MGGSYCCINSLKSDNISEKNVFILSNSNRKDVSKGNIYTFVEKDKEKNLEIEIKNDKEKNSELNFMYDENENQDENGKEDENIFEIIPDNMSNSLDLSSFFSSSEFNDSYFREENKINFTFKNLNNNNNNNNKDNPFEPLIYKIHKTSSFSSKKYLEIFTLSEEEVSNKILYEINQARLNPLLYSKKVEKFSKYICKDISTNENHIFIDNQNNQKFKVFLKNGKKSFLDCINFLNNVSEKMKNDGFKLWELKQIDKLKFPLPKNNLALIDDDNYIQSTLIKLRKDIEGKYKMVAFNYYVCFVDIEPLSILHILDDCNENKLIQKTIFSPNVKFVGINFWKLHEGLYIVYYIYSE